MNLNTNKIYVSDDSSVSVIDGTNDSVITNIEGTPGSGVGVNPNTNKIYVGWTNAGRVSIIDGAIDSIIKTIDITFPVGIYHCHQIAVNLTTNRIYAATNSGVVVIDGVIDTVTATIESGQFIGVGINSNTN